MCKFNQVIEAGHLNAIAFWFDLHLDEEISITTAPSCISLGGELTAESSGDATPESSDDANAESSGDASASSANPLRTKGRAAMQRRGDREPNGEQQGDKDFAPAEVGTWPLASHVTWQSVHMFDCLSEVLDTIQYCRVSTIMLRLFLNADATRLLSSS